MERKLWLDIAKGIGIILVVVGHVETGWLSSFIYLFHMPLFFILAGYLMKRAPVVPFVNGRMLSLIVPYVSYTVLLGIGLIVRDPGGALDLYLWGGRRLPPVMDIFWFVTVLFAAQIAFSLLLAVRDRPFDPLLVVTMIVVVALAYRTAPLDLRFNLGLVPTALFFLWCGYALKVCGIHRVVLAAAAIVSLSIIPMRDLLFSVERWPEHPFNMSPGVIGYPIYGLSLAIALSIMMMALCQKIAHVPVLAPALASVGAASMTIMFVHQRVHATLNDHGQSRAVMVIVSLAVPYVFHQLCVRVPALRLLLLGGRGKPKRAAPSSVAVVETA